jgi:tape measure domain-containing protein
MARKDVELVIRAKDAAAKAVDSVADALRSLVKVQEEVGASASGTNTTLGSLGAALQKLDKQLGGLSVRDRVTREFDQAAGAVGRLEREISDLGSKQNKLAVETAKAAIAIIKLKAEGLAAAAALKQQEKAVADAAASQAKLASTLRDSTAERDRLAGADARMVAQIERTEAAIEKAAARVERLKAALSGTEKPSKTLQTSFANATESLTRQQAKLDQLTANYIQNRAAIESSAASVTDLAGRLEASQAAFAGQNAALARSKQAVTENQQAIKAAVANQKKLQDEARDVVDAIQRESAALRQAQGDLGAFADKSEQAANAQKRAASAIRGALVDELARQRTALATANTAWEQSEAAVKSLAIAMRGVKEPSNAMTAAMTQAKAAAALAKGEFLQTRENVHVLQGVLREAGGNYDKLVAGQARFAATQKDANTALRQTREAAGGTAGALRAAESSIRAVADANAALAGSGRQVKASLDDSERASFRLANAFRSIYGESRTAMSWFQRLRGEVLALVAAYGGIFGAVQGVRNVVNAVQTLEAAQSRLNVAFDGVPERTAAELDFIRRTANRLGIEFQGLVSEYGKFAIATHGTELAGTATRKIFLAVAEAARVSKVSAEDMQGVFTALTQIVSKGAVQMEELRQQLGDRLPGAIRLMADGLGVSTAELIKMMEAGEVTSNALINFADRLNAKFGPQLSQALLNTQTLIGRLKNAAFDALVTIANAGFIERFNSMIKTLTETLRSAEADTFFRNLGRAMGTVFDIISALVSNFRLLVVAMSALVGIKLAGVIIALRTEFALLSGTLATTRGALGLYAAAAGTAAVQTGLLARGAFAARGAMALLASSTGIGLLVAGATAAISFWLTRTDEASEAVTRHRDIVEEVRNAYDRAGGNVDQWAKKIEKVTRLQVNAALELAKAAEKAERSKLQDAFGKASILDAFGESSRLIDTMYELAKLFDKGKISAEDFKNEISALGEISGNARIKEIGLALIKTADETVNAQDRVKQLEAVLRVMTGTATQADRILLGLAKATDTAGAAFDKNKDFVTKFEEGLNKLKEQVPELAEQMKKLKDVAKLDEIVKEMGMPQTVEQFRQLLDIYSRARGAVSGVELGKLGDKLAEATDGAKAAAVLLREFEGFIPTPKWDRTALRTGFGSDTITLSDGTIQKVTAGMRVSVEDANRDLARRIGDEFMPRARAQTGEARFDQFNAQQQAVLTSIAYNYGQLPERIIEAVRTGSSAEIAQAIRSLGGDNAGINRDRRAKEAALFEAPVDVEKQVAAAEKLTEEARKRKEHTQEFITAKVNELKQQELVSNQQKRQAEIEKEIAEARKKDPSITADEIARITELTGKTWDLKHAKDGANEAEKRANDLMTVRSQLTEQLQLHMKSGDTAAADQARIAIAEINTQLQQAIPNAIKMWEAIGGTDAQAKIATLKTTALTIQNVGKQTWIDWNRVGQLFASTLTNAFDDFAKAVAEGQKVGEAAKNAFLKFASDFLRQVAQMIIQQAILNALRAAFPSMGFGGTPVGVGHGGGMAGRLGRKRVVDPEMFATAMRYHNGGLAGLRSGEVPAILKRDEEILERGDPRHVLNGGGQGGGAAVAPTVNTKVINAFDAPSFLSEALNSSVGERAILNFIRANPGAVKSAIGV